MWLDVLYRVEKGWVDDFWLEMVEECWRDVFWGRMSAVFDIGDGLRSIAVGLTARYMGTYLVWDSSSSTALIFGASPNDVCKYWGKKSWLLRLDEKINVFH